MYAGTSQISYVCDNSLDHHLNKIEQIKDRVSFDLTCFVLILEVLEMKFCVMFQSSLVNHLVDIYNLRKRMTILNVSLAAEEELLSFHSSDYIDNLKALNDVEDLEKHEDSVEDYGLGKDLLETLHCCILFRTIYLSSLSQVTIAHLLVESMILLELL